jgi:hypothetical protein
MQGEFSKSVKKELRDLVYAAHEKALRASLVTLGNEFYRWQRGEIDAIEIADRIREFDQGPSRAIYRRFTWSRNEDLPRLVADAIRSGLLAETALTPEAVAAVTRWLSFYRHMDDENQGAAKEP